MNEIIHIWLSSAQVGHFNICGEKRCRPPPSVFPSVATWGRALFKITPQGISHSLNQFPNSPASFTLTDISKGRRSACHMKQIQFKPFLHCRTRCFLFCTGMTVFEFPYRLSNIFYSCPPKQKYFCHFPNPTPVTEHILEVLYTVLYNYIIVILVYIYIYTHTHIYIC